MEKHLKVHKSDKFNVAHTSSLSLFLYPDAIFIFAKDQNQTTFAIHEYSCSSDSLLEVLKDDSLGSIAVPIKVYSHDANFALVPGGLFSKGEESTYLGYVMEQKDDHYYYSSGIDSNKIQLVGSISSQFQKTLDEKFPEVSYHHGASSFLSYVLNTKHNLLGQEILINLIGQKMYAACFTDQELVSFTMFDLKSQADLIKYPRTLIAQHNFNPAHARISVFGKSDGIATSESWGQDYFHQYVLMTPQPNQNLTSDLTSPESFGILEAFWQFD